MTATAFRSVEVGLAKSALIRTKIINHVVLIVDASPSMKRHVAAVREQLRTLITDLAEQSREMDQETRFTVYAFSSDVRVLAFDVDVLRLPPVWDTFGLLGGCTALNDATAIGLDDLATTSTLYGDHGFLTYVITDGRENDSRRYPSSAGAAHVRGRVLNLPENWTIAALVPDVHGRRYAVDDLGIPMDNVAIWDVQSASGFTDAASRIRTATTAYMQGRASGVTGTRSLFSTGIDAVNEQTVAAALTPMQLGTYLLAQTGNFRGALPDFAARCGVAPFTVGQGFYEYTKSEIIQPQKHIVIVDRETGAVFHDPTPDSPGVPASPKVRAMIGLTSTSSVKEKPTPNPKFKIFIQSTAVNRVVLPGTEVFFLR